MRSVLVHGPQMCGKTRNRDAIAAAYGLANILDDWQPGQRVPQADTLILTNAPRSQFDRLPTSIAVVPYHKAKGAQA
ncbi:hypothetical protein UB43_03595 [Pseudomonas sp. 21]|uniref:hypothetical protein n=1 Tax=Pseudomonas sp. 21 TaxID=1619948 RepID=UPI0005EB1378|nr:hypothetical protein [Pseudomonas sp. 21]KJK03591.1 hypothetical protein UB43_03595 [Pseudomonas sp. 21]